MSYLLILMLLSRSIMCYFNLTSTWHDEFDQERLNMKMKHWNVEERGNRCREPYLTQLHCLTSLYQNVRTVDGVLALTAIYLDNSTQAYKKQFTSASIYSAEYLTQEKFEVRAAMPIGKLLRAQVFLHEPERINSTFLVITLVDFKQGNSIEVGVNETKGNLSGSFSFDPGVNLGDFHTYSFERNSGILSWSFDGYNFFNYNLDQTDDRLSNRIYGEMEIDINLVVGGPKMDNNFTLDEIEKWTCPSLLIDYVRVFNSSSGHAHSSSYLKNTEKSPSFICAHVQELRSQNSTSVLISPAHYLIPIVMSLLLIICVLACMLWHHKKQIERMNEQGRKTKKEKGSGNFYSTTGNENFSQVNIYEFIDENQREETYLEVYDDISKHTQDEEQPRYEMMRYSPGQNTEEISNVYI